MNATANDEFKHRLKVDRLGGVNLTLEPGWESPIEDSKEHDSHDQGDLPRDPIGNGRGVSDYLAGGRLAMATACHFVGAP